MSNTDYCRLIQAEPHNLRRCVELDADKQKEAMRKRGIIDYQCHAGLREAIAPVHIHDQLAGYLMIGGLSAWGLPASWSYIHFMAREGTPVLELPIMWVFLPFALLLVSLIVRAVWNIVVIMGQFKLTEEKQ